MTDAFGPTRLFRNRGDGTFEETTAASGIVRARPTRARPPSPTSTRTGTSTSSSPSRATTTARCPTRRSTRRTGARTSSTSTTARAASRDATKAWGLDGETRWTLSALFQDYDQDGRVDLLATNDFGLKNLYRNAGGRFEDVAKKTGTLARAYGMSGAWADFDGDGRPDLYATGTDTQWYFLHEYPAIPMTLLGAALPLDRGPVVRGHGLGQHAAPPAAGPHLRGRDGALGSAARRAGTGARSPPTSTTTAGPTSTPPTACGATAATATSSSSSGGRRWRTGTTTSPGRRRSTGRAPASTASSATASSATAAAPRAGAPLFEERAFLDGLDLETNGRAAVAFDANGDGALDLFVRSVQAPEALFLGSRRPGEHYLRLRLSGTPGTDNRDGIGARIDGDAAGRPPHRRARTPTRAATSRRAARSFTSASAEREHVESLVVTWPSGKVQDLGRIEAVDREVLVDEAAPLVRFFLRARARLSSPHGSPAPRPARLRRRRHRRRHRRRLDRDPPSPPQPGAPRPRRREGRVVRLEGGGVDGRDLVLLPHARPQALRPPEPRAPRQAGVPLLVPQREGRRACARRREVGSTQLARTPGLPARPRRPRRAHPEGGGRGRDRGLAAGEGRRLHARGDGRELGHGREGGRDEGRPSARSGSSTPPGGRRSWRGSAAGSGRSRGTRRRRSGSATAT